MLDAIAIPNLKNRSIPMRAPELQPNEVYSKDGLASLSFMDSDPHRDGGRFYRFEIVWPKVLAVSRDEWVGIPGNAESMYQNGKIVCNLTLSNLGNKWRLEREEAAGVDPAVNFDKWLKFIRRDKEKYGDDYWVTSVKIPQKHLTSEEICLLRDKMCELLFLKLASYEFNNDDKSADPNGYYPDEVLFAPSNLPVQFHMNLKAPGVQNV
jgi:hypothetical protein